MQAMRSMPQKLAMLETLAVLAVLEKPQKPEKPQKLRTHRTTHARQTRDARRKQPMRTTRPAATIEHRMKTRRTRQTPDARRATRSAMRWQRTRTLRRRDYGNAALRPAASNREVAYGRSHRPAQPPHIVRTARIPRGRSTCCAHRVRGHRRLFAADPRAAAACAVDGG
jgi:hypothetical protein